MLPSRCSPPVLDAQDEEPALVEPDGDREPVPSDLQDLVNIEFQLQTCSVKNELREARDPVELPQGIAGDLPCGRRRIR